MKFDHKRKNHAARYLLNNWVHYEKNIDELRPHELENVKINENPIMAKALQILNSAKDDEELKCYLEVLKTTQRALEINKA